MGRATRTALVVAIAVLTAALASYAVFLGVQRMPVQEVEIGAVPIVVARQSIPVGTLLTSDRMRVIDWPERTPIPGGFGRLEEVEGRGLIASVVENEPITESKLAPREAGAGLPPSIPVGMRAISVKVNEVIGVAGFVVPGTRVDVVVTVGRTAGEAMSRAVVSNVQVLAAGTRSDLERARDGEPLPSTVVTLLVTPDEGERIALASSEGALVLALRNPLDANSPETRGVRLSSLMAPPSPPPVIRQTAGRRVATPPPAPTIYTVEAIRAAERSEEVVR